MKIIWNQITNPVNRSEKTSLNQPSMAMNKTIDLNVRLWYTNFLPLLYGNFGVFVRINVRKLKCSHKYILCIQHKPQRTLIT